MCLTKLKYFSSIYTKKNNINHIFCAIIQTLLFLIVPCASESKNVLDGTFFCSSETYGQFLFHLLYINIYICLSIEINKFYISILTTWKKHF